MRYEVALIKKNNEDDKSLRFMVGLSDLLFTENHIHLGSNQPHGRLRQQRQIISRYMRGHSKGNSLKKHDSYRVKIVNHDE